MKVQLMQRVHGRETVAAVVSVRSKTVLYACVGPDAGGVLLAAVGWCRDRGYSVVSHPAAEKDVSQQRDGAQSLATQQNARQSTAA
jgi:hypothetical protein